MKSRFNYLITLVNILFCIFTNVHAQLYKRDLTAPEKTIQSNHLRIGGENFIGEKISFNNFYMMIYNEPVIPVTGEFHYSRYPNKYWDESIKKMKANGVNIIATYIFWNIHEEIEGVFNWDGDYNLRKFVELCEKNDLKVIIRLGPFCHGEIRNGGLPDWLLGRPLTIRSNDPNYLHYVERLYSEISKQVEGLLFKDGGPIIAAQLENEFQHSAAPWGLNYPDQPYDWTSSQNDRAFTMAGVGSVMDKNPYASLGNEHMKILKGIAQKVGIKVPLYTATGWGYAAIIENESLPVTAAYAYPTWASKTLSDFYIYTNLQQDPDYAPARYNTQDYPYFAAEISGGIMATYKRRPTVPAKSLSALINRLIGSGANGIGYYMFHGGSTPIGQNSFMSDEAYGYPKISYDFQAPVGEYGQPRESYNELKILHYFLNDFGNILAPMSVVVPNQSNKQPNDLDVLRYSVRKSGESGFIFMLNFQDHTINKDISDIQFQLETEQGKFLIPENRSFTLNSEVNAIIPFNFDLAGINLNYATAQLLSKLDNKEFQTYVFSRIEGIDPELSFEIDEHTTIKSIDCDIQKNKKRALIKFKKGKTCQLTINDRIRILLVDHNEALNTWKTNLNGVESLIISNSMILQNNTTIDVLSLGQNEIDLNIYPKPTNELKLNVGHIKELEIEEELFSYYKISVPKKEFAPDFKKIADNKIYVSVPRKDFKLNDLFLSIDYLGDTGMAFLDGKLVADNFCYGKTWDIGLKRFWDSTSTDEMILYFRPLYKDAPFYQDFDSLFIPDFSITDTYLKINKISFIPEYKVSIDF